MVAILGDLRFAWRQLSKTPLFAVVAVVTLALGIGANTAVFSVMDALLLRSLPVREPQGLAYVHMAKGESQPDGASNTGNSNTSFSMPVFTALRARTDVFADLMAFAPLAMGGDTAVRAGSGPVQAEGEEVSGNFSSGLTVGMTLGRGLTPADETAHAPVAVLSYAFWTREFDRDPGVVGRTLFVKGLPFTVVGVTARGFFGVEPATATDFWVPLQNQPALNAWGVTGGNSLYGSPNWWCLRMMARLRPGVSPEQAQAALAGTFLSAAKVGLGAGSIPSAAASLGNWKPLLAFVPARGIDGYSEQYRQPVQMLMGLVLLILLIAIVNVALMLVARNTARTREFSLRLALGVTRARLFRQLATESGLLVVAGAGLGWVFAVGATQVLAKLATIETGLSPNRTVLWFTVAISACMTFVFALSPLRAATRAPVCDVLRAGSTQMTQGRRTRMGGNAMIAGQVAVCLLLLVAAGLLLRTLGEYRQQPLGMDAGRLLVFDLTPQAGTAAKGAVGLYRQMLDRLGALPGVEGVSLEENRPGSGWSDNNGVGLEGGRQVQVRENSLGPGYFAVVGTPMLAGREFNAGDAVGSAPVAVVNATFAHRYFPHGSAVGHHLFSGPGSGPGSGTVQATVVGVVADSRYTSVDEPAMPMVYGAALQNPQLGKMTIVLRQRSPSATSGASGDPNALLPAVRRAVAALDPNLPLGDPMTQEEQFNLSYAQPTMFAVLGGFFGALAALLVATGLYGSLAYRTGVRSTEIGVRMALGAQRAQVVWLVLREGLVFAAVGMACGVPLTLLAVRGMGSMLWNLSPYDPVSLLLGMLGVLLVVAVASAIPARRAASVDPARAVRNA